MEEKQAIDHPDWNLDDDGEKANLDRTTGVDYSAPKKGTFDDKGRYSGSLNELTEFVDKELGLDEQGESQDLAEALDVSDRGNTQTVEWDQLSGHMRRVLTPDMLSTIDDEMQGLVNVLGSHGAQQVGQAIGDMSQDVQDVVLKVISAGVEKLGDAAGAHEAVLRALRTEAARDEWHDAVAKFPAILQEAMGESDE